MHRILFVASTLLACPALAQTPIDPPVASLPQPKVAMEQLSSISHRAPERTTASPSDAEAAQASPRYAITRRPPAPITSPPGTSRAETRFIRTAPQ